jgi:Ca2+/H+ antiporter
MQASNEWLAAAYDDIDLLEKQNADLKIQNAKLAASAKRSGIIGFSFGGVALGVGVPFIIGGARLDNQTMIWAGAGTLIGTGGIWALGHFLFNWW